MPTEPKSTAQPKCTHAKHRAASTKARCERQMAAMMARNFAEIERAGRVLEQMRRVFS